VRDVLAATLEDELHHVRMQAETMYSCASEQKGSVQVPAVSLDNVDLRLQVLCKVLALVFAARFSSEDDQACVMQLIEQHMGVEGSGVIRSASIDTSSPGTLRVGAVYLPKGVCVDPLHAWWPA